MKDSDTAYTANSHAENEKFLKEELYSYATVTIYIQNDIFTTCN